MFHIEEINKVVKDSEVNSIYEQYLKLTKDNPERIIEPNKLDSWVMNIAMGESGGFALKNLVIGVIEAAIFTYSHTLEEQIELAEKDSDIRLEKLSGDIKDRLKLNNKATKAFISRQKEYLVEEFPVTQQKAKDFNSNLDTSLEQQFAIISFNSQVDEMRIEQAKSLLKDFYKSSLYRDKAYTKLVAKEWGLENE